MTSHPSGHVAPDTLADSAEGLLSADDEAALRAHLAGCPECRQIDADLRDVSVLLAADPSPRMPDDVTARLNAALQAEPPLSKPAPGHGTTATAPHRSRVRRMPVWIGAAAAAVLGVTGAVLGVQALQGNEASTSSVAGTALEADSGAEAPESALAAPTSGREYTADNVADQVQGLLRESTAADSADEDAAADGREAAPGTLPSAGTAGEPAAPGGDLSALSTLATPAGLAACIEGLTGRTDVTPVAVDLASFEQRPAAVIVLPDPADPESLDVRIVGAGCSATDDDLIVATRVPRP